MRTTLTILALIGMIGCDWLEYYPAPTDFAYHPPGEPVEEPVDTMPADTIPVDTIPVDTCTFPEEVQEPQFCLAYHEITDIVQTDRLIIIGDNAVLIDDSNIDLMGEFIDNLWELYKPQYSYQTFVAPDDPRRMITFIKGTNDRQQFYLHAQIRYNGWKHYYGFDTKAIFPFGAISADQFVDLVDQYPSVYRFNFIRTDYGQTDDVKVSLKVLGHCKSGDWADFRFCVQPIPDSIPQMFTASHWNTVLHRPDVPLVVDLRAFGPMSETMLSHYDCRSQLIVRE